VHSSEVHGAGGRHGRHSDTADVERLFDLATDLLATAGPDGYFARLNPAWEQVLGWTRAELMSQPYLELVHPDDREATAQAAAHVHEPGYQITGLESRYRHRDGGWRWLLWSATTDGESWYSVAKDITDRKHLEHRAVHDPLTGLPNRLVFSDRVSRALATAARNGRMVALLFIDLDRFKIVNDSLGHAVGDAALTAAAVRLSATVRASDTVARIGGDEFVVLAEDVSGPDEAVTLARRVVAAFTTPIPAAGESIDLRASVGVAIADPSERRPNAEELLREADMAMYRAKAAGRARFEFFDAGMRREVRDRIELAGDLRHAVERAELVLHYQPIISLADGSVAGHEALMRWQHPRLGLLAPGRFIDLAEEHGLLIEIGRWSLETACRQGAAWRHDGHDVTVAVNVTPSQLERGDGFATVRDALAMSGLPATALWLELVPQASSDNVRLAESLAAIKELGVRVALHDFGSAAVGLRTVRELPLDAVKLDRAFVAGVADDVRDRAILVALLSLCDEMGLLAIAEGVETEEQAAQLARSGCDYAQGFWFAPPLPVDELELGGYRMRARPGLGDPSQIRELMRQIGIPARLQ
jgi:diguanylate cyclase (GGDEF)-like protein/PAS domain S-box-containing protein